MSNIPNDKSNSLQRAEQSHFNWKDEVLRGIQAIHFGSINIIVHNSRVVEVDLIEKIRFEDRSQNQNNLSRAEQGTHGKMLPKP